MAWRIYDDASRVEGPWPLACDPAVEAANDKAAIKAYLQDSDYRRLTVPEDAVLFGIRPLTEAEVDQVDERAGETPFYGRQVQQMIRRRVDEGEPAAAIQASLTVDEKTALGAYSEHVCRREDETLRVSVVEINGEPCDVLEFIQGIGRKSTMAQIRGELLVHIHNITDIGHGPKAPSSPPSTSPSSESAPGPASSATPTPTSGDGEVTAASGPSSDGSAASAAKTG